MIKCTKYKKANIGKIFAFTILKEITLPYNLLVYYVLVDRENCKFTIPKDNYKHYNFTVGQAINCSLDKINCSGQIFFEPINPYYSEGKAYDFEFIEFKTITNYMGFAEHICIVKDVFGKIQWIRNMQNITPTNNHIKATVGFIKKGYLFLLPDSAFPKILIPGNTFDFKIVSEGKNERFGSVYNLIDRNGNNHVIPIEYYSQHELKKHKWFKCTVKKFSSKGFFYIEPLHPVYTIGRNYTFEIINTSKTNNNNTLFIKDCFNNTIEVDISTAENRLSNQQPQNKPTRDKVTKTFFNRYKHRNIKHTGGNKIICEVYDLKKGKPVVKIASS